MTIVKRIAEEIIKTRNDFFYGDDFLHIGKASACSAAMFTLRHKGLIKIVCEKRKPFQYSIADLAGLKEFILTARKAPVVITDELRMEKYYREMSKHEKHLNCCADRLDEAMSGKSLVANVNGWTR